MIAAFLWRVLPLWRWVMHAPIGSRRERFSVWCAANDYYRFERKAGRA